jgi:predicted RNase H-like HicB family nuclease
VAKTVLNQTGSTHVGVNLGFFKSKSYIIGMEIKFTSIYQEVKEGYIGFVEELPGANAQGKTLEETRENLREAIELILEANRMLAEETLSGQEVIRETLLLSAA